MTTTDYRDGRERDARQAMLRRLLDADLAADQVLTGLSSHHLTGIPVLGEWSIRDVVAHCVAHDQFAVAEVRAALGEGPTALAYDHAAVDAFNAGAVAAMRALEPRMVTAAWRTSRRQVMTLVESLPDAALAPGGDVERRLGDTVEGALANNTWEHWALHVDDIRRGLGAPTL